MNNHHQQTTIETKIALSVATIKTDKTVRKLLFLRRKTIKYDIAYYLLWQFNDDPSILNKRGESTLLVLIEHFFNSPRFIGPIKCAQLVMTIARIINRKGIKEFAWDERFCNENRSRAYKNGKLALWNMVKREL